MCEKCQNDTYLETDGVINKSCEIIQCNLEAFLLMFNVRAHYVCLMSRLCVSG